MILERLQKQALSEYLKTTDYLRTNTESEEYGSLKARQIIAEVRLRAITAAMVEEEIQEAKLDALKSTKPDDDDWF